MAQAGIYDLRIHHDEILWPLLRHWGLFGLEGLHPQAGQARDQLAAHLAGRPAGEPVRGQADAIRRGPGARHDLLTTESGCSTCWAVSWSGWLSPARGAGRGCWTPRFVSSQSVLAGQDG